MPKCSGGRKNSYPAKEVTMSGKVDDDLTRTEKLRIAARVLIKRGVAGNGARWGLQSRLAEHFGVTRQRVSQIVRQELNARSDRE